MTDEELSRLLDEYRNAVVDGSHHDARIARAAIHAYFERRKSGEGGEDAARLDWMERNVGPTRSLDFRYSAIWDAVYINDYNESLPPKPDGGVRDAIDAARTEGKGNG